MLNAVCAWSCAGTRSQHGAVDARIKSVCLHTTPRRTYTLMFCACARARVCGGAGVMEEVVDDLIRPQPAAPGPPPPTPGGDLQYGRSAPQASLLMRMALHSLVFGNARAVAWLWQRCVVPHMDGCTCASMPPALCGSRAAQRPAPCSLSRTSAHSHGGSTARCYGQEEEPDR